MGPKEERTSFFEKKEAKKLYQFGRALRPARAPGSKSFLVLFFKKERLPYSPVLIRVQARVRSRSVCGLTSSD
jgi:hypothetical protein